MRTGIALLRGINVSGKNSILMKDLRFLCESLGWMNVSTYLQSGNIIFQSEGNDPKKWEDQLEQGIREKFGYTLKVFMTDETVLNDFISSNPFPVDEPSRVLFTLLESPPLRTLAADISKVKAGSEEFRILDHGVLLYCPDGYGKSKVSNAFLEKKNGCAGTTRNWKTMKKLYETAITVGKNCS